MTGKNSTYQVLDEHFKYRQTLTRLGNLPLRTKEIFYAEILIFILQFSFVPFIGLLNYEIVLCDYGETGNPNPIPSTILITLVLSTPFFYAILWYHASKKFDSNSKQIEFEHQTLDRLKILTFLLGLVLVPIIIGFVYVFYSFKTHERKRMVLSVKNST